MENSNQNSRSDQLMVMAGLKDLKAGSQLIFVILAIFSVFFIILELLSLVSPRSAGQFMMIFANQAMLYIVTLATIGVVLTGLIFSLNGLNKINDGSSHDFVKGSSGPNKMNLLIALVSFSIISFISILMMLGVGGYRIYGFLTFPALAFIVTFYIHFPMMTFIADGIGKTIGNTEISEKATKIRMNVLIMVGIMILQYIIVTTLGRDALQVGLVVGIGSQIFGITVYNSYFRLWGYTGDNYVEKAPIIGSQSDTATPTV